jgi:hypothetical protein
MVTREKKMRRRPAMTTRRGGLGLRSGLVAYWQLEEGDGLPRLDVADGNDLTQTNGVTQEVGKINFGAGLDGVDQYLSSTSESLCLPSVAIPEFTMAGWAKLATNAGNQILLSRYATVGDHRSWILWTAPTNTIVVLWSANGISTTTSNAITIPAAGSFFFFAMRVTDTDIDLFVNDTTINTDITATGPLYKTPVPPLGVGARVTPPGFFLEGVMDEIGAWKRPLSDDEITTLYNGGSGITYPFQS